jgi:hypothetical protein
VKKLFVAILVLAALLLHAGPVTTPEVTARFRASLDHSRGNRNYGKAQVVTVVDEGGADRGITVTIVGCMGHTLALEVRRPLKPSIYRGCEGGKPLSFVVPANEALELWVSGKDVHYELDVVVEGDAPVRLVYWGQLGQFSPWDTVHVTPRNNTGKRRRVIVQSEDCNRLVIRDGQGRELPVDRCAANPYVVEPGRRLDIDLIGGGVRGFRLFVTMEPA